MNKLLSNPKICLAVIVIFSCFGCVTNTAINTNSKADDPSQSHGHVHGSEFLAGNGNVTEGIQESENMEIPESLFKTNIGNPSDKKAHLSIDWPVDSARLTRGFIPERKKRKRPHWGIDLASRKGSTIFSAHEGRVIYTGREFKGYGKMVLIENDNGWASIYAHLDTIKVKQGQIVPKGVALGGMGRTGRATGVHLHFELRHLKRPVDPLIYLPGVRDYAAITKNGSDLAIDFSSQSTLESTKSFAYWLNPLDLLSNYL